MKQFFKTLAFVLLCLVASNVHSQNDSIQHHYFQISPRVGYDILPMYKNNTPYIDYKGGIEFGISLDYYWRKWGVGIDYDNISNQPKSTFPTDNLYDPGMTQITNFNLSEKGIKRTFIGIGPNYQYQSPTNKFTAELNTRVGISSIKGGRVLLNVAAPPVALNFHAGYNAKSIVSLKTQVRFNYFFNQQRNFGAHFGIYYLRHLKVFEESESGVSALYYPFTESSGKDLLSLSGPKVRSNACECDISSIGIFAGITYRPKAKVKKECEVCCNAYALAVTAKDKFTGEVLPNTDVAIKNLKGEVVQTGTTNSFGVVVFDPIDPDTYTINGLLYNVALDENMASKNEFVKNETLQKEILYSDTNFILQGNAVACNTDTPIENVSVILKNLTKAEQKNTVTDKKGVYIFHLNQKADYSIYGKKENYMSQVVTLSTKDYDRNTTLFVKLEICLTYVDCNKAIPLKNIHFDLDKDFVRDDAKLEFNKLVAFMRDNPSVIVELSSHTDSQGSDSYNIDLSQRRAANSKAYIVSQGINPKRLIAKGYGETRLLNRCSNGVQCTDKEHEVNRRTEFKVLCPE